ncbi:MAG: SCO family protein [Paracoccus sp. (in: a-proteobacteria)]
MRPVLTLAAVLAFATAALPHEGHDHGETPALAVTVEPSPGALPDADVIDQFGNRTRFREAIGPGAYVLSFTYTRCTEICGMADLYLSDIAERRADFPAPLRLVTLTLDPARDRPGDLLERHRDFGAPDDWLRLTGDPAEIMPLLIRLGAWDGGPLEDHKLFVIVGHAGRQQMTRLEATPLLPDQIHDLVATLAR